MILALLFACVDAFPNREGDFDGDGIPTDVDCDDTDPDVGVADIWFIDGDGDRHASMVQTVSNCGPAIDLFVVGDDCDDTDPTIFPGALEQCDGKDDDCDETVDDISSLVEGAVFGWPDLDGDLHGNGQGPQVLACASGGFVISNDDCDDGDASIHPDAPEVCGDGVDNDCDQSCGGCCFGEDATHSLDASWFTVFGDADLTGFGHALASGDLVGDGVSALAVATPSGGSALDGRIHVFPNATIAAGGELAATADPSKEYALITGEQASAFLGWDLATTDLDGDLQLDLLVGAPLLTVPHDATTTNGAVYVLHGPLTAGMDLLLTEVDIAVYGDDPAPLFFGSEIESGFDANGDGLDDTIVGGVDEAFSSADENAGDVWLYWGGIEGPSTNAIQIEGNHAFGGFGKTIRSGDVSSDGIDDLLIAASGVDNPLPTVGIYEGAKDFAAATQDDADVTFTIFPDGGTLGSDVTLGDFDGDGALDVAAGLSTPGSGAPNARVLLYLNEVFAKESEVPSKFASNVLVGNGADQSGASLAARDVNGDEIDDLLIGAPGAGIGGAVHLVLMPATIGELIDDEAITAWNGALEGSEAGSTVLAVELDGDAWPDVVVASPGASAVHVWPSEGF